MHALLQKSFGKNMSREVLKHSASSSGLHGTETPAFNSPPAPSFHDISSVEKFISKVTSALLGGDGSEEGILSAFALPTSIEKINQFINDNQTQVLYIVKGLEELSKEDVDAGIIQVFLPISYSVELELQWKKSLMGAIALIKNVPVLYSNTPISHQIQVINLPGPAINESLDKGRVGELDVNGNLIDPVESDTSNSAIQPNGFLGIGSQTPYEAIHSLIHYGVSPYLDSFIDSRQKAPNSSGSDSVAIKRELKDSDSGLPMAKKRLAELELALLQLQHDTEIPEPNLIINKFVKNEIEIARNQHRRVGVNNIDPLMLSDSKILNSIQADVNSWIKEIQKVTNLVRDPITRTASQEINFWINMEKSLEKIEKKLSSEEVVLTLDILKAAKRFHVTVSFMTDIGLKEATDLVLKYNILMRDLPLNDLLSASDMTKVCYSIDSIFSHINKKLKITPYPIHRALNFVEMISVDFRDQVLKILGGKRLLYLDFNIFESLINGAESAFSMWDEDLNDFINVARDTTRKRNDRFIPLKINSAHESLKERLVLVAKFRRQHEQLIQTIDSVMDLDKFNYTKNKAQSFVPVSNSNAGDPVEEIRLAYDAAKHIDVLDVSNEGILEWEQVEAIYNERVSRVENQIISKLRDRLAICKNANEMFRVFSQFNALFIRPKIRGAIQEYQTRLIISVKGDIKRIHDKFKTHFHRSSAFKMTQLRDIPLVSGEIIWTKEIERQLDNYMKRVEDVLGKGWELYADGQRLKSDSESFRQKLNTKPLYDSWYYEISRSDLSVSGRVFLISRQRATNQSLQLSVKFDAQLVTLFKEVRELLWIGFQVPHTLVNVARDGRRVYPFAVSLGESIRIYKQTVNTLTENMGVSTLADGYRNEVQSLIQNGFHMRWDLFVNTIDLPPSSIKGNREQHHVAFVRDLALASSKFQEKVQSFVEINNSINDCVNKLSNCPYSHQNFLEILEKIQELIDRLSLDNVTNLNQWVQDLDDRIEAVLSVRAEHALKIWIKEFIREPEGYNEDLYSFTNSSKRKLLQGLGVNQKSDDIDEIKSQNISSIESESPKLRPQIHEITIRNQIMYVDPPLDSARASWIRQLHEYLSIVCLLPRPLTSRYDVENGSRIMPLDFSGKYMGETGGLDTFFDYNVTHEANLRLRAPRPSTYKDILSFLPHNILTDTYLAIEEKIKQANEYVEMWLQYQALWDLNIDRVSEFLGSDLDSWQTIISEIKNSRSTFDNQHTSKSIGLYMQIDYGQVQSKVNSKYDSWQSEIISKFGIKLGSSMQSTYDNVINSRRSLEQYSSDTASTSDAVAFITFMEDIKRKQADWKKFIEITSKKGQKLLERQRYKFPADWIQYDRLESEWFSFNEILSSKARTIKEQISGIQQKIVAEDKLISARIHELVDEWEKMKPTEGSLRPATSLETLSNFESRMTGLSVDLEQVNKAKSALGLQSNSTKQLEPALEELSDLKSVWSSLSVLWNEVDDLSEMPWTSVVPRKLRASLDALYLKSKSLPDKIRQYSAFNYMNSYIQSLIKQVPVISDLKSDSLKDRHWRKLFKVLSLQVKSQSELTLGYIWTFNIIKNESIIREVIITAQGEMGLEEFLKQVKETWTQYSLELVTYQNKCRLIKGWDELFSKCSEHLSALSSMKASPYYRVFEEESSSWEEKLTRVHMLFDVWIDVQRQWVYLEGIFSNSADIKHLLPIESSRFQNINTEFLTVMKRVYKSPYILDVLNMPNIQKSLERLLDLLGKIQRALGEYLERERLSFPRFYFVGDEDLLEIIGNSKDISRIQKHIQKMFAGIFSIKMDEEGSIILGMVSRQGEEILFRREIDISKAPKINEWLSSIEAEMKNTLADMLFDSINSYECLLPSDLTIDSDSLFNWIENYPAQLVVLASQIRWTSLIDSVLTQKDRQLSLSNVLASVEVSLQFLADTVLKNLSFITRKKTECLITELVHQRDVLRDLIKNKVHESTDFEWLKQMRFYYDLNSSFKSTEKLSIVMANATFKYGFEYLGVIDRLVQTPLTDRCFLTLTQALDDRLGGSPFGPAGTGKTESVKALGAQLGRFVLVFCCDETFDFQAVGRIFSGLCQVGAWGCFDEFNRLEERILSAVSQQIQSIQLGLKQISLENSNATPANVAVELVGRSINLNQDTGIFITMNPDYAGRSNLPDNLKKLFRSICMTKPDYELIAQVMLYSQGFRFAELLARKVVPLFNLCSEQLSLQPHYDFGLRALKPVLVSAGLIKRNFLSVQLRSPDLDHNAELGILIQSIHESILPKLISPDITLFTSLLADLFPGINYSSSGHAQLKKAIQSVCSEKNLTPDGPWMEKLIQLYQIQKINHGIMMVGPTGTGKSTAWKVLLEALERIESSDPNEKSEGVSYIIDPKALSKETLYGTLDLTTREWKDGLFTQILRKIIDNVRGESSRRHWIIFDGDVDPEWVENLNSVLDDNRLLTLPNGERLSLPQNVRIMFEVESLKYATPATVSRCGMVWFSENVVDFKVLAERYLRNLETTPLSESDEGNDLNWSDQKSSSHILVIQSWCASILRNYFSAENLIHNSLLFASSLDHIMEFTPIRALNTLFLLLNASIRNIIKFSETNDEFGDLKDTVKNYLECKLLLCLIWSFAGDSPTDSRVKFSNFICGATTIEIPLLNLSNKEESIIDYDVVLSSAGSEWIPWASRVPTIDIETHKVTNTDIVIPTSDTLRHEDILYSLLSEHKPLLLCGPPGSGKTMTLFSALRKLPELEIAGLNFSAATSPDLILKTFEQHCEYRKTPNGVVLSPSVMGRWLVVFCDEINLPARDKYGTQHVISFIRQLMEQGGFWRSTDHQWIKLERIQFVGACNPPTDPGRVPLPLRFLSHVPLVMVDYPGEKSLHQIYSVFCRALLKVQPRLRTYSDPLTSSMIDVYLSSQRRFTPDIQAHYIYSPRELTRWVRGVYESIHNIDELDVEGLVRVWAHEGLRLFQDRLVSVEEREWTDRKIDEIATKHFPSINLSFALSRPILFSNWLSRNYVSVEREYLREHVKARLRVFYEEELDVPLVLFNDVLDHVLRIDRIMHQSQGHALLIGVSGSGKTTLTRFVAWMNGLSVFQIKAHNRYSATDFDDDLRTVLRRAGTKGERVCFILDESNVLEASFLERMNTLLANAEIPGLFEGDEYLSLLTSCREGATRDGLMLDSPEELYKWFSQQVAKNLHVVFTMNPPSNGLSSRTATSPALFNRCVLDWFGDWNNQALYQVGSEFTSSLDINNQNYIPPNNAPVYYNETEGALSYRTVVINAFVSVHNSMKCISSQFSKRNGRINYITPRHYLDFIQHFTRMYNEKISDLEEQQRHLNVGLDKLHSTVEQVQQLRISLAAKKLELEEKTNQANNKLKQMVEDQNEAEKTRAQSLQIQAELETKNIEIQRQRTTVMADLDKAEPAVLEAQQAVSGINRAMLTEVRSMSNPPTPVKLAIESACILLGHKQTDWRSLVGIIRKDDFITSIMSFDTENKVNRSLIEHMRNNYLKRPDYNFEAINRASRACGPLVKWVIAQVNYSTILEKVGPLRNLVKSLENDASATTKRGEEIENTIKSLELSIAKYKDEYAILISETQHLKSVMEQVSLKVDRSLKLIESLSSEKTRWQHTSSTFIEQLSTIAGDVLLSSAFLSYSGFFDQEFRERIISTWVSNLDSFGILFREHVKISEYLTTTEERLSWQTSGLQTDDLAVENAVMLHNYNRFPLIIDPSGKSLEFLQIGVSKNDPKRKLTITSFLDDAFLKHLESALRFGNPIIIQDAEHVDPILNPVLNKELRKTGGRVLIRLGSQDIDYSPSFELYLFTKDTSVTFSPDVSSRVTFVNFTATRASLQAQCLNQTLLHERPDIEKRRTDMVRIQGEFRIRLHTLEKGLLSALSDVEGNILDNDSVIETLERLKKESEEIALRVSETDGVVRDIDRATGAYTPLAKICSSVYFTFEKLSSLHPFYQFSLEFFQSIFNDTMNNNKNLDSKKSERERLEILQKDLFLLAFNRASPGILHKDHLSLLLQFSLIKLQGFFETQEFWGDVNELRLESYNEELSKDNGNTSRDGLKRISNIINDLQFLLSGIGSGSGSSTGNSLTTDIIPPKLSYFIQNMGIFAISIKSYSNNLYWCRGLLDTLNNPDYLEEWVVCLSSNEPELLIPKSATLANDEELGPVAVSLRELLLICLFRPDRILTAASRFLSFIFNPSINSDTIDSFVSDSDKPNLSLEECGFSFNLDLQKIIDEEQNPTIPISLCSVPGFDASFQVESLALKLKKQIISVAMGSIEGFSLAENALETASKSGKWVLLKNVHLSPSWLVQFEKKLKNFSNSSPKFKIFLTMEINPKIPKSLLRGSRTLLFESSPGLKANVLQLLQSASSIVPDVPVPSERTRLHFLLSWLHSILTERVRHVPLGWTRTYEFNDADFACAISTIDKWLSISSNGRSNLAPEKIPWNSIRFLLINYVYGGTLVNDFDMIILKSFIEQLFQPSSFSLDFRLIPNNSFGKSSESDYYIETPEATSFEGFIKWAMKLPESEPPTWLGLPENADIGLLGSLGKEVLHNLVKMRDIDNYDENASITEVYDSKDTGEKISSSHNQENTLVIPSFSHVIKPLCETYLEILSPLKLSPPNICDDSTIKGSLQRAFEREYLSGYSLFNTVTRDLDQLLKVCAGTLKLTNHTRDLVASFASSEVPGHWAQSYVLSHGIQLNEWISDFSKRVKQLSDKFFDAVNMNDEELLAHNVLDNIWMGGLFYSDAFVTATRQAAAKKMGKSLEELELYLELLPPSCPDKSHFDETFPGGLNQKIPFSVGISGLILVGAGFSAENLKEADESHSDYQEVALNDGRPYPLGVCRLYWSLKRGLDNLEIQNLSEINPTNRDSFLESRSSRDVVLPVYLNSDRKDLLFNVSVIPKEQPHGQELYAQRGVSITAS
ncbi:Cytoplasmic dynein 1 heavy chain 1 [Smittium mucronatum]|uniref:Dynein heavy chain, cytoplasmic n=1 Tax=Smittium mucronatum TaxID=133383 RepID=A0A1R0GT52_9FUNG|nr:Cytoplasmic dynein 1 heavy chain 1 [Smittium mucronatum]